MVSEINPPFEMPAHAVLEDALCEEPAVFERTGSKRIGHQGKQGAAQPFMRGNVEPDFLTAQNARGKFVLHQLLEHNFLARSVKL